MKSSSTGAVRVMFAGDRDRCLMAPRMSDAQTHEAGHVHQRRRPDLPGKVRNLSPARFDCADVSANVRRGAAVGSIDPRPGRVASDAAVAHRQDAWAFSSSRTIDRSATIRSRPSSRGSIRAR